MSTLKLRSIKKETKNEGFDASVQAAAEHGRISAEWATAVLCDWSLALPASPAKFVAWLNREFLTTEAGTYKQADLIADMRDVAVILSESGKCKNLPAVLPLPQWATVEGIAAAKAAAAEKRATTKAAKAAAGSEGGSEGGSDTAPIDIAAATNAAVNTVIAAAKAGALTADQKAALIEALSAAMVAA